MITPKTIEKQLRKSFKKRFQDKTEERRKHIEIRRHHPNLDIRFVFGNSKNKIFI